MKFRDISSEPYSPQLNEGGAVSWPERLATWLKAQVTFGDMGDRADAKNQVQAIQNALWSAYVRWYTARGYGKNDSIPADELQEFFAEYNFLKSGSEAIQKAINKKLEGRTDEAEETVEFTPNEVKSIIRAVGARGFYRAPDEAMQFAAAAAEDAAGRTAAIDRPEITGKAEPGKVSKVGKISSKAERRKQVEGEVVAELLHKINDEFRREFQISGTDEEKEISDAAYRMFLKVSDRAFSQQLQDMRDESET